MDLTRINVTSRLIDGHREITLMSAESKLSEDQVLSLGPAIILKARYSVAATLARVGVEAAGELYNRSTGSSHHWFGRPDRDSQRLSRLYCYHCGVGGNGLTDLAEIPELYVNVPPSETADWRAMLNGWLNEVTEANDQAMRGVWW